MDKLLPYSIVIVADFEQFLIALAPTSPKSPFQAIIPREVLGQQEVQYATLLKQEINGKVFQNILYALTLETR